MNALAPPVAPPAACPACPAEADLAPAAATPAPHAGVDEPAPAAEIAWILGTELAGALRAEAAALLRAELDDRFADLRGFLDRRLAEVSAEVHASTQLADLAEAKLSFEIARVQEGIGQLVAMPAAATRNSGLELEAVVQVTESAAGTILDAAESIQDWIARGRDPSAAEAIAERVNAIFEACAFQDLTGQRIRRAIQHLQQVETTLRSLVPEGAATHPPPAAPSRVEVRTRMHTVAAPAGAPDLAQADIDALLNG